MCNFTKLESSRLTHLSETKVMWNHGVEFPETRQHKEIKS